MSLSTLPVEIKLRILGFLDFVSLHRIRNTNRAWQNIVNDSLTRPNIICPARVKLLRLYLDLHLYPSFRASRKNVMPYLEQFSREKYLENLQSEISKLCPKARIPEEFALWIMEWPENAIIDRVWPGVEDNYDYFAAVLSGPEQSDDDDEPLGNDDLNPDIVGLIVEDHGCNIYTILFVDRDTAQDGMIWLECDWAYMHSAVNWQEFVDLEGSWIEWLHEKLKRPTTVEGACTAAT